MSIEDLVAEHGSPLWLVNVDILRDRWRSFAAAWNAAWPELVIAYSYKANRASVILRTLAGLGAVHEVDSEIEYELARSIGQAAGPSIVVQGPGKSDRLLERAAADGALVIADGADDLARAARAGVGRLGLRVGVPGGAHGQSQYGVPATDVPETARSLPSGAPRLEALATHTPAAGFDRPLGQVRSMTRDSVAFWPHPSGRIAASAHTVAALAVRLGIPVVDVGGGFPPPPDDERLYARAVTAALGAVGFEGRLIVEPGRAIVGPAVDLACSVLAVKRLPEGMRCVVLDAGRDLIAGALWRWPHLDVERPGAEPVGESLVIGPGTNYLDILHPAASLPHVCVGDIVIVRRVGAYNQSDSTRHGELQAAVVAREHGHWRLCAAPGTVDDLRADLSTIVGG